MALSLAVPALAQEADSESAPSSASGIAASQLDAEPSGGFYQLGGAPDDATVTVEVRGAGDVVSYDNADLRGLDESSIPSIIDSDDRATYGRTDVDITAVFAPTDAVSIDVTLDTAAYWGDSASSSRVGLGAASVTLRPILTDSFNLSVRAGRQRFEIGGAPRDYYMRGMVDGFTVDAEIVDVLTLRLLPFDFFAPNETPESRTTAIRPGGGNATGMRGETNTYRTGAVLQTVDQILDGLDLRLFFMHASIGGNYGPGTGSDISEGGLLGNFRDRDYQQILGFRGGYGTEFENGMFFDSFAEVALSNGIDRKEATSVDVDGSGSAFGLGIDTGFASDNWSAGIVADWHRMSGAEYSVNGLEFQRGFTSMFGDRVGGLASGRIAGMRPSSSLDSVGILHNPEDVDRNAGTDFLHVALELEFGQTELNLGFWTYKDTRESGFDQTTLDTIQPPPEHSREEFAALRRSGLSLGQEIDIEYRQGIEGFGHLFARGGIFLPGEYYAEEVSSIVTPLAIDGNQRLGGQETFWAVAVGAEFGLGYRSAQ